MTEAACRDRELTRVLGWFSIGLGLAELLAPRAVAHTIGVGHHPVLMRMSGLRGIASGMSLLAQRQTGRRSWLRVAGEVMDLALLGAAAASPRADRGRIAAAGAALAGLVALDLRAIRRVREIAQPETASAQANPTIARNIAQTIAVAAAPTMVYGCWRHFENLPRFMRHLERVTRTEAGISRWVAPAPAGNRLGWDTEIVTDERNHQIGWRTLPGSSVRHGGRVQFVPERSRRGTRLRVTLRYAPPPWSAARLPGEAPQLQMHADLRP